MTSLIQVYSNIYAALTIASAPNAYIDPNTGGMLFQMLAVILALFSGVIFFFSRQIKSGIARLRRRLRGDSPSEIAENSTEVKSETSESSDEEI